MRGLVRLHNNACAVPCLLSCKHQGTQGLDEVQSYVLLRRWLVRSPDEVVGSVLLPAQRAALAAEYALERLCLLKCLEGLLLHRYATAGGGDGARPGLEQARALGGFR